jgi:hypothetical protein
MSNADAAPPCDFCAGMPAVVYCRADSARLCLPCDRHVHGANTVCTRHARAPLCAAPGGFLCGDCDFEDRAAVQGYTGCPSIRDLAAILGVWWPASAWEEPQVRTTTVPHCSASEKIRFFPLRL